MSDSPPPTVTFSYGAFRDHFCGLGDVTEDVVARVYTAAYPVIKYGAAGDERPFVHCGMTARELRRDDPLRRHGLFRLGEYVVHAAERERDKKQQLYAVHPEQHADAEAAPFFTADHFSFVVNRNAGARPLHFHHTAYVPVASLPGRLRGLAVRDASPLPTSFDLPTLRSSGLLRPDVAVHSDVIAAMLARPFLPPAPADPPFGGAQEGPQAPRSRRPRPRGRRRPPTLRRPVAGAADPGTSSASRRPAGPRPRRSPSSSRTASGTRRPRARSPRRSGSPRTCSTTTRRSRPASPRRWRC